MGADPMQSDQRQTGIPIVDGTPLRFPGHTIFGRHRADNGQRSILAGNRCVATQADFRHRQLPYRRTLSMSVYGG